jgi:dTDP-4-dehydrorhamnose reductase
MRIGITGANGRLGRGLVDYLTQQHEVMTFGRRDSEHFWTLGVIPSPSQLKDLDVVIHLAWSLRDRAGDYHLNVGGTLLLAQAAEASQIPFLFVSSLAVTSNSAYGKSKAEAELAVLSCSGMVIRVGLVPELNRYELAKKSMLSVYPNFKFRIQVTSMKVLCQTIDKWIASCNEGSLANEVIVVASVETEAKKVLSPNSRIVLPIPISMIRVAILICKPFSLRARNLGDALLSVTTNRREISE